MVKYYKNINEKVYSETLNNGLKVILIPKFGFKKTFVTFGTKYGALTNKFVPYGEKDFIEAPYGIAHFLEHKMFEMPDGTDATELFANLGLESNASTNYTATNYLFGGTNNIDKGLNILLDFVQTPHFTDENVLKEQGIIEQELKMYLDDPVDALHLGLMQNIFQFYPLRHDVGGTVDSIKQVTKEFLYHCYNTFYHPSNMHLVIVGDPDNIMHNQNNSIEEVFNVIRENQNSKEFPKPLDIRKNVLVEDNRVLQSTSSMKMDIIMPKVAVGIKLPYEKYKRNQAMMMELKIKILLEATLGPSTDAFQEMIDLELINGNIYYDAFTDGICGFVKIQANTFKPKQFINFVKEKILSLSDLHMEEEVFERFKKAVLGNFLKSLNSLEFIAFSYLEFEYKDSDIFEAIGLFEKLTIDDLRKMGKYFVPEAIADFTILPKNLVSTKP